MKVHTHAFVCVCVGGWGEGVKGGGVIHVYMYVCIHVGEWMCA